MTVSKLLDFFLVELYRTKAQVRWCKAKIINRFGFKNQKANTVRVNCVNSTIFHYCHPAIILTVKTCIHLTKSEILLVVGNK